MRIGFIGCGTVALDYHLPACVSEPGIEVVACADPTSARLERFGEAAGLAPADRSADYRELLARREVDAVIVATPPAHRPPIVFEALAAGKHVLSEKPIALTPADGWAMARAAREAGLRLAVMHNYLFRPDFRAIRRVLEREIIGRPYVVTLNFLGVWDNPGAADYRPGWRHDPRASGGGVLMDMMHVVYLLHWLMDAEPRGVSAAVDRRSDPRGQVEETALCRFEYSHGFGLINMAWGDGPGGIEVMGTEGRLLLLNEGMGTAPFVPPRELHVYRGRERIPIEVDLTEPPDRAGILRDFVASVTEGREPLASAESGCATLEGVVAAYTSAYLERQVTLPLQPTDPVYRMGVEGLAHLEPPPDGRVARLGLFNIPTEQPII